MRSLRLCGILALLVLLIAQMARADEKPIVGLIPKARQPIAMNGTLDSWEGAFVTPLNATHPDFMNRATDIYYLWNDEALYIGVRALDTNLTHISPDTQLYDGDALEFYLDTRQGADLGKPEWGPGTLHAFFTAITGHEINPRFHVRDLPAFHNLTLKGVELAAKRTQNGYTLQFKLPWSNFPNITPKAGVPIGIDIEMGSADGGHRVHRTFAYSSPTSVGTPSTLGRVLLVDQLDLTMLKPYSRALFPFDAQMPGNYGRIYGVGRLSPTIAERVTKVEARLLDGSGAVRKTAENAGLSTVARDWRMWRGEWETFDLPAGTYTLVVTARDAGNNVIVERTRHVLVEP